MSPITRIGGGIAVASRGVVLGEGIRVPAVAGGGPTTYMSDTFTDTSALTLASHTSTSGHTWAVHSAYPSAARFAISNAGRCRRDATAGTTAALSSAVPASADYDVAVDYRVVSAAGHNGVGFRFDGTTDEGLYLRLNQSTNAFELFSTTAAGVYGSGIGTAAQTVTAGNTHPVLIRLRGNQITVLVNSVQVIDVADTLHPAAGRIIVRSGSTGSDALGIHLDNLVVTSA